MKPDALADNVANEPYAWPGGYPKFAITDDGGCLCQYCCKTEIDRIAESIPGDGWYVTATAINWEDNDLYCDHCGEQIEAAYD